MPTKMPLYGAIITIKRTGEDGKEYPLKWRQFHFGSCIKWNVRIVLPSVAPVHCVVKVTETKEVTISYMDPNYPITLNDQQLPVDEPINLNSGDIFAISDRSFRFETFPPRRRASISDGQMENGQNGENSEDNPSNEPATVPKRARKQTVAQVQVEEVVVSMEKVDVEISKSGRGRKLVIANENLITNSNDEPATVPKRARRQAVQLQEEDVINPVEKVDIEKPKRGRKLAVANENLITNIAENRSDEPVTVTKQARKQAVAQVQVEEVVVPVEKMDIEKPKRGRKRIADKRPRKPNGEFCKRS